MCSDMIYSYCRCSVVAVRFALAVWCIRKTLLLSGLVGQTVTGMVSGLWSSVLCVFGLCRPMAHILTSLTDSDGLEQSSTSQVTQSTFTTGPLPSPLKPLSTLHLFLYLSISFRLSLTCPPSIWKPLKTPTHWEQRGLSHPVMTVGQSPLPHLQWPQWAAFSSFPILISIGQDAHTVHNVIYVQNILCWSWNFLSNKYNPIHNPNPNILYPY